MKKPSRLMPADEPTPFKWWHWALLAALAAGIAYGFVRVPGAVAIIVGSTLAEVWQARRQRRAFAAARRNDSICTFARSFERRSSDTWIIRATHDELTGMLGFPVRASDQLRDLSVDDDDLEDIATHIALRARRSTSFAGNPFIGQVNTVGDLVRCLHAQPSLGR